MDDALNATTEAIASEHFGANLQLHLRDIVYGYENAPSLILRYALRSESGHLPKTIIAKRSNVENDSITYDANALRFLSEVVPELVPQYYTLDITSKIMLMEDLNSPQEHLIGNILFGDDRDFAEEALLEFLKSLARLHLATMGHERQFRQIQASYGDSLQPSRHQIHDIPDILDTLPAIFELINVQVDEQAQAELSEAKATMQSPNEFYALVHGDATPANAFYYHARICLVDFETADFRHCLLDGTYARIRYLRSVWARDIPIEIQRKLMRAYQDIMITECSLDKSHFEHHYVACAVGWMVGLCQFLPTVLEQDRKWGRSTNRQRVIAGLVHFARLSDELAQFEALGRVCRQAGQQLRQHWAAEDCTMRLYPAFDDKT